MPILLLIEITWDHLTWLAAGFVAALSFVGLITGTIKSVKGEFWTPFKEKILSPWQKKRRKFDEIAANFDELKLQVADIYAEFKPNGGSSLKDAVNRIEKHLDYANAKFRHMDETSSEPLFEADENAGLHFANRAMCVLLGAEESDLLARNWVSRIPTEERERVLNEWASARENRCALDFTHLVTIRPKKTLLIRVQATPRFNRDNDLRGFFGRITQES